MFQLISFVPPPLLLGRDKTGEPLEGSCLAQGEGKEREREHLVLHIFEVSHVGRGEWLADVKFSLVPLQGGKEERRMETLHARSLSTTNEDARRILSSARVSACSV
mmetsp:Transcript_46495/g.91791  ORF Transcript_46495/g.91791 Transcript_46495/m.91791 type:complete len:106 (-) Transcript_46495:1560-1877(-)